ncbi:MAG: aldehyde dehydrogenase family protein [Actinomycetota bacterium]
MEQPVTQEATLVSFNPATGKERTRIPANTPEDVRAAVAHAREAAPAWAALPVRARAELLNQVRYRIAASMDEILETVAEENGKPRAEALTHDVLPSMLTLAYLGRIAPKALRARSTGRALGLAFGSESKIEWRPFGVVGCITPWNYPMFLSFMAITPALLAGNTVVLKPSEMTPAVGELIREVLAPLPPGVATIVQGGGDVGAALVDAPCDKICFIGSGGTGRRIAEAAARHLTPVVMELGGQDATLVCDDANLDLASSGVLWGSFLNAGQTCCAIERIYVAESVADEFERLLVEKLGKVRTGVADSDIGPLTIARQLDVVRRHVDDAISKGARLLAGGPNGAVRAPDGSRWFAPTIIAGRSADMDIFREETFGPVVSIVRVADDDEAVRRANGEGFNLTASVWTRDAKRGVRIRSQLRAGGVSINDHGAGAGVPWGTWGGVGESGYGRLNGPLGLREFAVPVSASRSMLNMKKLWWYPYDEATNKTLRGVAELIGDPRLAVKAKALREIGTNALRAIRAKI